MRIHKSYNFGEIIGLMLFTSYQIILRTSLFFIILKMQSIQLLTENKIHISATLFSPIISNGKLLLINSATGVKQTLYFSFAQFFCSRGFTVITYDYEGIGDSKLTTLRKSRASMRTWGSVDFKVVTNYIKSEFPDLKRYCLGHSVGALILGMNPDSLGFEKFIFVATQKAYIGNLNFKTQFTSVLGFGLLQPLITKLYGYFPAPYFRLGENLPKEVAKDWRTLVLHPKSTNKLLENTLDVSHKLSQKVLVLYAEDDPWVTKKGIDTLLQETYPSMTPTYRKIKVSESKKRQIGHVNFFRSYNEELWEIVLNWLQ